jgi:hypothetical protein
VTRRHPPHERTQLLRPHQIDGPADEETSSTGSDHEDHAGLNPDDDESESGNEDGVRDETPLLPIFSAAHLGSTQSI